MAQFFRQKASISKLFFQLSFACDLRLLETEGIMKGDRLWKQIRAPVNAGAMLAGFYIGYHTFHLVPGYDSFRKWLAESARVGRERKKIQNENNEPAHHSGSKSHLYPPKRWW